MKTAEHKRELIAQGAAHRSAAMQASRSLRDHLRPRLPTPETLQRAGVGALAVWLGSGPAAQIATRMVGLLPVAVRLWSLLARRKLLRLGAAAVAVAGITLYLRRKGD